MTEHVSLRQGQALGTAMDRGVEDTNLHMVNHSLHQSAVDQHLWKRLSFNGSAPRDA